MNMNEQEIKDLKELLACMCELCSRFKIRTRKEILENIDAIGVPKDKNLCEALNRVIAKFVHDLNEYNPDDESYNLIAARELNYIGFNYLKIVEEPNADQTILLEQLPEIIALEKRMDNFERVFPDLSSYKK